MVYKNTYTDGYPRKECICWVWDFTIEDWILAKYNPFMEAFYKYGLNDFSIKMPFDKYNYKVIPKPKKIEE